MKTKKFNLKGKEYNAKLDFATLGRVQSSLRKQDIKIGFQQIFKEVEEQNFAVVNEIIVQSVLRCHPQIKRETIEEKLDLEELENAFTFLAELIQESLPQTDKKK